MIKRFYITIIALIFGLTAGFAQNPEVKLNSVTASAGSILVHVDMTNFTANVNSISIQFNFDPALLTYNSITNVVGFTSLSANLVGNVLKIGYFDVTGYKPNGRVFDVSFNYTGTSCSNLVWETPQCSLTYGFTNIPNVNYVNGTVCPPTPPANPVVRLMNVTGAPGTVNVPVIMKDFVQDVNSFTYNINFDDCLLDFINIVNKVPGLNNGVFAYNVTGNTLTVSWSSPVGFTPSSTTPIFEIVYDYSGGFDAQVSFGGGNSVTYGATPVSNVSYILGTITQVASLGTVSMPTVTSPSPGTINVPIHFAGTGYSSVGAFELIVNYDPAKMSYLQLVDPFVQNITVVNSTPGVLKLSWFNTTPVNLTNQDLVKIKFNYTGVSCGNLDFKCGSYVGNQLAQKIASSFTNGAICPVLSNSTLDIANVTACGGQEVILPIVATNLGSVVGVEMHFTFDNVRLTYLNIYDKIQLNSSGTWFVNQTGNTLIITWLGAGAPQTVSDGDLIRLHFQYNGCGCGPVTFNSGSTVTLPDLTTLQVSYLPGEVCPCTSNQKVTLGTINGGCTGTVCVPITLSGVDPIGALDLIVNYDGAGLSYTGLCGQNPALTGLLSSPAGSNPVHISWSGTTPVDANGEVVKLQFAYTNDSPLTFACGTMLANGLAQQLPVQYINGEVNCNVDTRVLTVSAHGTSGTVSVSDGSTVLGTVGPNATAQFTVLYGKVLTLLATPPTCWVLSHWTGDSGSGFNPFQITLDADKTVNGYFYQRGDANGDGSVNGLDITSLVNHIMGNNPTPFVPAAADVNLDGNINGLDITMLVNFILYGCQ